ncbi:ornithine decarboxylase antizyme 2-like [Uloborus diversus]|uniref:ornithine decarboxylase antizyme 2-like n=1 Tax=Uloborus diversus TaxID=327109 RepID=UPI002409B0BF|nr:ornithine decarboxylase antizyme 2-like [Uloborus diversus]
MPAINSNPFCSAVRSRRRTLYPLVQGLCGVPDVPHAANVLLLNAEGSGVGKFKEPPVTDAVSVKWDEVTKQSVNEAAVLVFNFQLTDSKVQQWNSILWKRRLYVTVPDSGMTDGSKESFLTLLEFAEDDLQCSHVIVCFGKSRPDKVALVRTFMFLGFSMLAPGHKLAPSNASEDTMCMIYIIEEG